MNTNLSSSVPSQQETECLVAVVLDRGEKDKPAVTVESTDAAVRDAAKDGIESETPARHRRRQGQEFFRCRTAQARGCRCADLESEKHPQLCLRSPRER